MSNTGIDKLREGVLVHILAAGTGCEGCDGTYGVITFDKNTDGLLAQDEGINVKITLSKSEDAEIGSIWRVNLDCEYEVIAELYSVDLCNRLIEDRIDLYGLMNTIQYLLDYGVSKEDLIEKFRFDEKDIDAAIIELDEKDCDNCGMTGVCKTCCKTCGKIDCDNHNPEYEEQWKTDYPMVYAEIMETRKAQEN